MPPNYGISPPVLPTGRLQQIPARKRTSHANRSSFISPPLATPRAASIYNYVDSAGVDGHIVAGKARMAQHANCPRCDKPVEPEWRFCPNCEAVLLGSERGSIGGLQHTAVRLLLALPQNRIAVTLAFTGVIGLCLVIVVAGVGLGLAYRSEIGAAFVFGAFVVLVFSLVVCKSLNNDYPAVRVFQAFVVGVLALVGGLTILSCAFGGLMVLIQKVLHVGGRLFS
jgi:hypothetical protein